MTDKTIAITFVWHGEECFRVSTVNRDTDSMCAGPDARHDETHVRRYDWFMIESGELLGHAQRIGAGRLSGHTDAVRQLEATGEYVDPRDDTGESE